MVSERKRIFELNGGEKQELLEYVILVHSGRSHPRGKLENIPNASRLREYQSCQATHTSIRPRYRAWGTVQRTKSIHYFFCFFLSYSIFRPFVNEYDLSLSFP